MFDFGGLQWKHHKKTPVGSNGCKNPLHSGFISWSFCVTGAALRCCKTNLHLRFKLLLWKTAVNFIFCVSSSDYFLSLLLRHSYLKNRGTTHTPVHHSHSVCFLTYDLSILGKYGCVLSDRGAGGHKANSLPGCLGFDLRNNDVSAGKILVLTPTFSCVWEDKAMELQLRKDCTLYLIIYYLFIILSKAKIQRDTTTCRENSLGLIKNECFLSITSSCSSTFHLNTTETKGNFWGDETTLTYLSHLDEIHTSVSVSPFNLRQLIFWPLADLAKLVSDSCLFTHSAVMEQHNDSYVRVLFVATL